MENLKLDEHILQIRDRSNATVLEIEKIRADLNDKFLPELDQIRQAELKVIAACDQLME